MNQPGGTVVHYEQAQTPGGKVFVRSVSSGTVTGQEIGPFLETLKPNGRFVGLPIFSLITRDASFSAEARQMLNDMTPENGGVGGKVPVAIVVQSTLMRLFVQFVLAATRASAGRVFSTEEAAIEYLDSVASTPRAA